MSRAYRARVSRPATAETREQILGTVRELLSEGTFHDATVESIAARAEVARSTLYQHFGSRMGLIDALCDGLGGAPEYAAIREALELDDAAASACGVVTASIRFWAAEEHLFRSLYGLAEIDPAARAFVERQTGERRAALRALARRLNREGRLRLGLSEEDAFSLLLLATSFPAYDELRRNATLTSAAVERAAVRLVAVLLEPV